ncbi:MAG TPA: aldo/keto reductase [Bacilli bacterium]|nr:MAG: General stress protein 69 [Tenericutes bacterium ADurb.BinA124]HNZ50069.1 aldo/keto reductase [Bacilli bacterium]HPX84820.1 aldo/keto reductase [Bacilli bacterium]HQC74666.1 aldo/keto reductase [Bacilli bacterium]
MEYRSWYERNIKTSLLGFGAMRLKTVNGEIDEAKGLALFDYAYKHGINYYDTAMPYTEGKNETFVGKALKRYPRDSFYLASKLSLGMLNSQEEVLGFIDRQLENLQTSYLDMYLLHALNKERVKLIKEWDILTIVKRWQQEGKIRNIGFSFHDDYETFTEILAMNDWDFCQIQLNYMDTDIQQGIKGYEDLVERKIPVVIMEPIKGGKLATFSSSIAEPFRRLSSASNASWALRWVGSLPGVKVMLSGMNEMEQLVDNLATCSSFQALTSLEYQAVKEVKARLEKAIKVDCTNCRYCMPCTVGIDIPGNFRIFNSFGMYNNESDAHWQFNNLIRHSTSLTSCIECGKCVEECPQHIQIPDELKRMKREMTFLQF